jgi:hypothetical protein
LGVFGDWILDKKRCVVKDFELVKNCYATKLRKTEASIRFGPKIALRGITS